MHATGAKTQKIEPDLIFFLTCENFGLSVQRPLKLGGETSESCDINSQLLLKLFCIVVEAQCFCAVELLSELCLSCNELK